MESEFPEGMKHEVRGRVRQRIIDLAHLITHASEIADAPSVDHQYDLVDLVLKQALDTGLGRSEKQIVLDVINSLRHETSYTQYAHAFDEILNKYDR